MSDMDYLVKGFAILAEYDDTGGSVDLGGHEDLFAGPQNLGLDEFTPDDIDELTRLGWSYDDGVGRWGYQL